MDRKKSGSLKGQVTVPGDKSISHRSIMLGALAKGPTEVMNFLEGNDCLSTIQCFRQLGIEINHVLGSQKVTIHGQGLHGLTNPNRILDVGNSGTTIRLMSGIISGTNLPIILSGDESIQRRPMNRIIAPLTQMEADIHSMLENGCAPLYLNGHKKPGHQLRGINYISSIASAQVKSCLLFAGLYADQETSITEPSQSRNHSELMLQQFGATIKTQGNTVTIEPEPMLIGQKIIVPGDISSAAYFMVAGLIVPRSEILIKNVGINPTRSGIIRVCQQMGANLQLENIRQDNGEPTADILVHHSQLQGIEISGDIIPTLIDELPIIALLACFAKGKTIIKDAAELKVKESNRIELMVKNLTAMGANIIETNDGMIIEGENDLTGTTVETKGDHRIAMTFAIASLAANGVTNILDRECVDVSYPGFYQDLNQLIQD